MKVMREQDTAFATEGYRHLGMHTTDYNLEEEYSPSRVGEAVSRCAPMDQNFGHPAQAEIAIQQTFDQMHNTFTTTRQITQPAGLTEGRFFLKNTMNTAPKRIKTPLQHKTFAGASAERTTTRPPTTIPYETPYRNRETAEYVCTYPDCEKRFGRSSRLSRHMLTHTKEKPYICQHTDCEKAYGRKEHLKVHLLTHAKTSSERKPFFCTTPGCDAHFSTAYHLKRHAKVHTKKAWTYNDKPFQYSSASYQSYGGGEKELVYNCKSQDCDIAFSSLKDLRSHILEVHPPVCGVCGKTLLHRKSLSSHMLTHANNKQPFECDRRGCGKKFKSSKSLITHIKTLHDINLSKIFKCPEDNCTSQFVYKHTLSRHIVNIHNRITETPSSVTDRPHSFVESSQSPVSKYDCKTSSSPPRDSELSRENCFHSQIEAAPPHMQNAQVSHMQNAHVSQYQHHPASSSGRVLSISMLTSDPHCHEIIQPHEYIQCIDQTPVHFKYPHQDLKYSSQQDHNYTIKSFSPGGYYNIDGYYVDPSRIDLGSNQVINICNAKYPNPPPTFTEEGISPAEYYYNPSSPE